MLRTGGLYQVKLKNCYLNSNMPVITIFDLSTYATLTSLCSDDVFVYLGCVKMRKFATVLKVLNKNVMGYLYKEELEEYFEIIDMETK